MRAIIIDDESNSRELLSALAEKYTPEIEIVGRFDNGADALKEIDQLKPDILFLDIEMPNMNGFDFLEKCPYTDFYLIFTTAYNEYAIKAIKNHAFDYLLKPIKRTEFIHTIERLQKEKHNNQKSKIDELLNHLKVDEDRKKIVLATQEGMHFLEYDEIMYVKGEGAYSHYYCADGSKYFISKTLKDAESKLTDKRFKRVHASYIMNFDFVKKYQRGEGGFFVLKDGTSIPVSRSKKQDLLGLMEKWQ
ncbi:MAG: response regulator [Saprospiraceae bacterium]|nr:response regulator [Saprospiraceae bacterium]